MRAISILFIIILTINSCENFEKKKKRRGPSEQYNNPLTWQLYWIQSGNTNSRTVSCSQPNAINALGDSSTPFSCISSRVTEGAISNANTGAKITTDTVTTGGSFKCQCPISGKGTDGNIWSRTDSGNVGKDNPPLSNVTNSWAPNQILTYSTGQTDNLYCIAICQSDNKSDYFDLKYFYYQILKIR